MWAAAAQVFARYSAADRRRAAAWCTSAALVLCAFATEYAPSPREPYSRQTEPWGAVAVTRVALPASSLVLTTGWAASFVAPYLDGPGVRFVGVTWWALSGKPYDEWEQGGEADDPVPQDRLATHRLAGEVLRLVRSHRGPMFMVIEDTRMGPGIPSLDTRLARALDVNFDWATCYAVRNNLTQGAYLCRVR
jgi:hypothetical protein